MKVKLITVLDFDTQFFILILLLILVDFNVQPCKCKTMKELKISLKIVISARGL